MKRAAVLVCSLLVLHGATTAAQTPDTVSPQRLKGLTLEQLANLEVMSVSRRPESLFHAASAIQVITGDDIRRSGARSLPEALRLAPNLQVAQINARNWAIAARGFNGSSTNKLLVLLDGRTIYTPLFSGVFWDAQHFPWWDVDRIEVISGPGATLWGSNAVNGVINIITKHARDSQGLYATGMAGSEIKALGGVRWGGRAGSRGHYRVYGKGFARDGVALPNGSDALDDWDFFQGGVRADWEWTATRATFQSDIYDGRVEQPPGGDIDLSGANVRVRVERSFSAASQAQLQVFWDRRHRTIPNQFAELLDTYDADLQLETRTGRHLLVGGVGYRLINDHVGNSAALAFLPPHVTRDWINAFLQDEITLTPDRLSLTLGTKVEHNDYTGVEVQPSARVTWRPRPRGTLWAAVSRAVRTPSRIDRELFTPGQPPFTIAGGAGFDSEKLIAYEAGYRVQPREALSLSLALFYNRYDDLRSLERVDPNQATPIVLGNGYRGRSHGAELAAEYRLTEEWRLRAGWTELRVQLDRKPGSTDTTGARSEAADPRRHLSLRSSWNLPAALTLDAHARYVGPIAIQQVPGYAELDLRLAWVPSARLQISLAGRNLLHARHAEFGAAATRREIERGVFGQVTWQF